MRSEDEIRQMAERLEDESRSAEPSAGRIGQAPFGQPEQEKDWRRRRARAARKAQALRWVLGEEIRP